MWNDAENTLRKVLNDINIPYLEKIGVNPYKSVFDYHIPSYDVDNSLVLIQTLLLQPPF